jgi:hypothetical protein
LWQGLARHQRRTSGSGPPLLSRAVATFVLIFGATENQRRATILSKSTTCRRERAVTDAYPPSLSGASALHIKLDLMYEPSSTLVPLGSSLQPLWRYVSAERLEDLLSTGELFFVNLPVLEDAYEGALTARSREYLARWFERHGGCTGIQAEAEVVEYEKGQTTFYVNCWHMRQHESYLMWKAYAHRGYAIETSFERLTASLDASPAYVTGGMVEYVDFARDLTPVGNVFNHVATKDLPYQDEREFRLVFWDVDPRNADYPRVANGVRVKVDLKMLIRRIVRSPFPEPDSPNLLQLLDGYATSLASSSVPVRGA